MALFRNDSPGALTLEAGIARHIAFLEKERRRIELAQKAKAEAVARKKEAARMAKQLATQGRGSDTEIAHLAPGEIVVPRAFQTPELMAALDKAAAAYDVTTNSLRVGDAENSINPRTGAPEFGIMDSLRNLFSNPLAPTTPAPIPPQQFTSLSPGGIDMSTQAAPWQAFVPRPTQGPISTERQQPSLDDGETGRRARVIFGETAGVWPAPRNPAAPVYRPDNWDPVSADELAKARAYIGVVSARNDKVHSATPDLSKYMDRQQWGNALEAAQASRNMDNVLNPQIDGFYLRQQGSGQRPPYRNTIIPPIGPFANVGGGDVPRGNQMYFDYFRW